MSISQRITTIDAEIAEMERKIQHLKLERESLNRAREEEERRKLEQQNLLKKEEEEILNLMPKEWSTFLNKLLNTDDDYDAYQLLLSMYNNKNFPKWEDLLLCVDGDGNYEFNPEDIVLCFQKIRLDPCKSNYGADITKYNPQNKKEEKRLRVCWKYYEKIFGVYVSRLH